MQRPACKDSDIQQFTPFDVSFQQATRQPAGRWNGDEENYDDRNGNEDDKDNDEDGDTRLVAKKGFRC